MSSRKPTTSPAGPSGRDPLHAEPLRTEFAVTVDLVLLTVRSGVLHVLLVTRGLEPCAGHPALPGGFVLPDEGLAAAAARELREETGLEQPAGHLEQLATYGDRDRDPRGRVVSVAFLAMAPDQPLPRAGTDAADARWCPVDQATGLAFDHDRILADGVERARSKLEYTPLGAVFCAPEFTVADLRRVYEAAWGTTLDPRNFHRKVIGTRDFLEPTGATREDGPGRPAALFRLAPSAARALAGQGPVTSATLQPPLLRPEH